MQNKVAEYFSKISFIIGMIFLIISTVMVYFLDTPSKMVGLSFALLFLLGIVNMLNSFIYGVLNAIIHLYLDSKNEKSI